MGPVRVYLGLGSNLGDREANLAYALRLLAKSVDVERISSLYQTAPWGYEAQPNFLNCACGGWTSLRPQALLTAVKDVERGMGRGPTFLNGPRLIDVDILFYGQEIVSEPGLEIPHPRLAERAFVVVPLAEVAAEHLHPVLRVTVAELLQRLAGSSPTNAGGLPEGVELWGGPIPAPRLA